MDTPDIDTILADKERKTRKVKQATAGLLTVGVLGLGAYGISTAHPHNSSSDHHDAGVVQTTPEPTHASNTRESSTDSPSQSATPSTSATPTPSASATESTKLDTGVTSKEEHPATPSSAPDVKSYGAPTQADIDAQQRQAQQNNPHRTEGSVGETGGAGSVGGVAGVDQGSAGQVGGSASVDEQAVPDGYTIPNPDQSGIIVDPGRAVDPGASHVTTQSYQVFGSPIAQGSSYVVQKGDTLSHISERSGVTVGFLAQANPQVHNIDYIYTGDVLTIPHM